jgi:L-fuculose-phosphate aldolase
VRIVGQSRRALACSRPVKLLVEYVTMSKTFTHLFQFNVMKGLGGRAQRYFNVVPVFIEAKGHGLVDGHSMVEHDFIDIDFDGRPLAGDRTPPMEFHLHSQIYLRRPDVHAIVHTHPRWSTVLTTVGQTWKPVTMQAAVLGPVKVFEKTASINSVALGLELADFLGSAKAALMRRHGAVTVAASVPDAFVQAIYLEENAHRQFLALQIGTPQPLSDDECAVIGRNLSRPVLLQKVWGYHAGKHFPEGL